MLTPFKTPMGVLCHCILSPVLLASTISQHSVCVCLSPSLSERISHPLLLQLLAASLLIPPSAPFFLGLLSYVSTPILHPTFSFSFPSSLLFVSLVSPSVELPTVSLSYHLFPPPPLVLSRPTTSSLLPTPLLLTGQRGGGLDAS